MAAPLPSKLDERQILQGAFDEATGTLRTTAEATIVNADIDVALDATEDNVAAWVKDETGQPFTDANYVPVGQSTHDNLNLNANLQVNNTDVSNSNRVPSTITAASGSSTFSAGLNPSGTIINKRMDGDDPNNTTTTLLLAGQTFTGVFTDCSDYAALDISLLADVDSAVNEVKLQFSSDGITIIREQVYTYTAASGGIYASFPTESKYFRFVYKNGAVNQTFFSLEVHLHTVSQASQIVPIGFPLQDTYSAMLTRSIITGKSVDGTYNNLKSAGIATANSTTTPLLANATYTGTFQEVLGFSSITVFTVSDQDSATNGLVFEYSTDGITVDGSESFSRFANDGHSYVLGISAKYFRIKYINGAVNQTSLKIQTMYHIQGPIPHAHKVEETMDGQHGAQLSKSIIAGKREDNIYQNVGLSNTGSMKVAITDRPSEVRNRVKVEAAIFNVSLTAANTVIYTVTVGKTLYISSLVVNAINTANAIGEYRIRDNVTDKVGFLIGEKTTGAAASMANSSPSLPEPISFTTSVTINEVSGAIQASVYILGYEE